MAAQTEGRDPGLVSKDAIPVKCPTPLDVAAAVTIYGGSLVFVNASGYAVALSPDQTMTCAGFAENDVDNVSGSNGTLTITPRIGCISLVNGSGGDAISADDVGKMAYASDNQTANLTSSSGTRCAIGPILGMDGSRVFVLAGFPLSRELAGFTAVSSAPVVTTTATAAFSAETNLGALADGFPAIDVTGGLAAINSRTFQAPAAGFTITNPAGVAGDPTFVLSDDLAALEALDATAGIIAKTAANTYARRTLQAPAAGITIANPAGTAGDPTFALANGLMGLEALAGTGLVSHTGADTYIERTLTAPAAGITVANGDGVAGNPTLALADDLAALEALDATAGLLAKTAANTYARRTLTAPAAGITVANGDGAAGNPTLSLANGLAALEALAGTGIVSHTGADTYTERSVAVGSTALTVSNGDGVAGNPTLNGSTALVNLSALAGTGLLAQSGGAADAGTFVERTITAGSVAVSVTNGSGVAGNPTIDNLFVPITVADPGTGVAIPVTRSSTINLTVGAGAETNTMAAPSFVGQTIRLYCASIGGGTRAITVSAAFNVAGNTILTFNAARDNCTLIGVLVGAVLTWEIQFNASVALS